MSHDAFDPDKLSGRERDILDGAIEGLTDIQIAFKVGISASTVNSYWVRIRGKLGQLSRTELVALALKKKSQDDLDAVNARLLRLQDEARTHARGAADYAQAETFRAALDAMPEAVLVVCELGLVRYANPRMEAMFGYDESELLNQPFAILVPKAMREAEAGQFIEYLQNPRPMRIGFDRVVYGQRRDGSLFRIALMVDSRSTSKGPIFTCLVRDFATEIETRRAYASAY